MRRRYQIYDVFTERMLTGNPLAVVLDAEELETAQMQAIAREFNLSETAFVLDADNPAYSARVRIFTPAVELPFAGHPTVGTAICLASERFGDMGSGQDAVIVLEEGIGPVRCGVRLKDGSGFAEFDLPRLPKNLGEAKPKEVLAEALGLTPNDVTFENHKASVWSAGNPFQFVPVRNGSVLATANPIREAWTEAFGEDSAFLYTRDVEGHDHDFRARMFAPMSGIEEDPATGSAVAAFAGLVQQYDDHPDGDHVILIEQGDDMGRPSVIRLEMTVKNGVLEAARIGGHAVRVAEGVLFA
jgi:trans-2,3-dihydro-3-hydroxyanthranilate isomerase